MSENASEIIANLLMGHTQLNEAAQIESRGIGLDQGSTVA
jgi:hypothetical protein